MSDDLFIRRVYTHKGISVAVDIDLIKKEVSLVQKNGNDTFQDKNWYFTHRGAEFLPSWLVILDAMKFAISEAAKVLDEAKERDEDKFAKLLFSINNTLEKVFSDDQRK